MCEGWHVEKALDELWGHAGSQPQEHAQPVGQQEGPSLGQALLGAAHGGWHRVTLQIQAVLWGKRHESCGIDWKSNY